MYISCNVLLALLLCPPSGKGQRIIERLETKPLVDVGEAERKRPPPPADLSPLLWKWVHRLRVKLKPHRPLPGEKYPFNALARRIWKDYVTITRESLAELEEQEQAVEKLPVRSDKSIFVSISSFRDRLCSGTVENVFRYANKPEKVFVGLVDQRCGGGSGAHAPTDSKCFSGYIEAESGGYLSSFKTMAQEDEPDCLREVCTSNVTKRYCENGQIRGVTLAEEDAMGPLTARFLASKVAFNTWPSPHLSSHHLSSQHLSSQHLLLTIPRLPSLVDHLSPPLTPPPFSTLHKLWRGEQYFMQVDSHSSLANGWDSRLLSMIKRAPSHTPVVRTAYTLCSYTLYSYTMHHTHTLCTILIHYAPCTIHHHSYAIHYGHTLYTIHHTLYTIHHAPSLIHYTLYTIHHHSYTIHHHYT
jgi:hypothetical protein